MLNRLIQTLMPSIDDGPQVPGTEEQEAQFKVVEPGAIPLDRQSQLKLDDAALAEAERWLLARLDELRLEMGLEADGSCTPGKWMAIRAEHQDYYDGDRAYRVTANSIFDLSNETTGENKRYVREMTAKVADDMFGTVPFFTAMRKPMDVSDAGSATEEYLQVEAEKADLQDGLKMAVRCAMTRNEAVVKIWHDFRESYYFGPATIMVDRSGMPLMTPETGIFIYENDDFVPHESVEGLWRLRKDPTFVMRAEQFTYKFFPRIKQRLVHADNARLSVLDFRSFLCPLRCDDIHAADTVAQLFSMSEDQIKAAYGEFEPYERYRSRCHDEESGEDQARTGQGEQAFDTPSTLINKFAMAEVYCNRDFDGDGVAEETMWIIDLSHKKAVFWDYLGNHMGKRPFEVIPGVEREPNRWYGVGVIHMMEGTQLYIDSQLNRVNVLDSRNQSVTFRDPNAVKEWKAGQDIEFGTGKIYDVEPGYNSETRRPVWREQLQEVSELGMHLMEKMQQQGNMQFGVISVKDASANNLNNSRTATGVLNMERTANVLTKSTENDMAKGLMATLAQFSTTALENMQTWEVFFSRDGKALLSINKEEARSIGLSVKLLLSRARSSESIQTGAQVIQIIKDYRMMMLQDPTGARMVRETYIDQLKNLEVREADKRLPEITDEMIQQHADAQAQAAKEQNGALMRELMNYKDTPPTIQRQMESDAGYQPAPPEEVAAEERKENDANKAKAAAKPAPPKK